MHRAALAALAAARPALSRLDRSRAAADLSADLVAAWAGVETGLRALLGGSPLSGAPLIQEARARHLLTFDQANALAAFAAVTAKCADAAYQPADRDINSAREGFEQFESSLQVAPVAPSLTPGEAMSTKGLRLSPLGTPRPVPLPAEGQPWWFLAVIVLVIAAAGTGGVWWFWMRDPKGPEADAIAAFQAGRAEEAVSRFDDLARRDPTRAMPHVYLARLAREAGDLKRAREQAALAVQAEPENALALREMAAALLASRDYELARRFYVRVVQATPNDSAAMGFLGCTLMKLGRVDEGDRWISRAGDGPWRSCVSAPPSSPGKSP